MANYPNHHLIIGGYFSTWAFNLVMSEVLREFDKLYKERRGQRIKLVDKLFAMQMTFFCLDTSPT